MGFPVRDRVRDRLSRLVVHTDNEDGAGIRIASKADELGAVRRKVRFHLSTPGRGGHADRARDTSRDPLRRADSQPIDADDEQIMWMPTVLSGRRNALIARAPAALR